MISREDKHMSLTEYQEKISTISQDKSIFASIKGHIIGKGFLDALNLDLFINHELKHLFIIKPTFLKYTYVDEAYRKLVKFSIPTEDRWEKLCELIE